MIEELYQTSDGRGRHDYFVSTRENPTGKVVQKKFIEEVMAEIDEHEKLKYLTQETI